MAVSFVSTSSLATVAPSCVIVSSKVFKLNGCVTVILNVRLEELVFAGMFARVIEYSPLPSCDTLCTVMPESPDTDTSDVSMACGFPFLVDSTVKVIVPPVEGAVPIDLGESTYTAADWYTVIVFVSLPQVPVMVYGTDSIFKFSVLTVSEVEPVPVMLDVPSVPPLLDSDALALVGLEVDDAPEE